jgi:vitamin K-dependent gamma-carboxylase
MVYPMLTRFRTYLVQPIGGQVLGLFRILYSLFMAFEMIYYLKIDLVKNMFVLPSVNFKYDGLAWLTPMSGPLMTALVGLLFLLSLMMATGIWFKWAARLFAIGNAYIFFQDTSLYNNHIYLYILLAWLLSCTHADQFYSMRKKTVTAIPRWEQFIFQLQMVIVYFYAGVSS